MFNRLCYCLAVGFVFLLAAAGCTPQQPREIALYISRSGNDSWSGKLPIPNSRATDGPFATLERAREAVRSLKETGLFPEGGITIYVREPSARERIDDEYHDNILQADLAAQGITRFGEVAELKENAAPGMELFFRDERMTLARWPEDQGKTCGKPDYRFRSGICRCGERRLSSQGGFAGMETRIQADTHRKDRTHEGRVSNSIV